MNPKPSAYILELRPIPGNWRTSGEQRLRAALKTLLRGFGLRCVACKPAQPEPKEKRIP